LAEHPESIDLLLEPVNNEQLANVCGQLDEHLRHIERRLGIEINNRGNHFRLIGERHAIQAGEQVLQDLYRAANSEVLDPQRVHLFLQEAGVDELLEQTAAEDLPDTVIKTRRGLVRPRGVNQKEYLHKVLTHDINFGVGPAGTGKTYLAVASAVDALERDQVRRILLVRPAVEAGERLGFLPGDLAQKIDPYLRPLYDALYEMLGFEKVAKLVERNVIEIAPLAYMRGRTLNESFVILDEAQNTTPEQMKMFLTRIGFGSTAVITGDITQIDLSRGQLSGLRQASEVLAHVEGISFTFFNARDVVRHPVVQRVVRAYDEFENKS
jgi:phosphate starvation-inducible protein PhoH and related proteins